MDTADKREPTLAREYLRVSHDKSGRERSVHEQQDDNRKAWAGLDFNGEAYSDVSISASRYSTKARGGWAKLLDDLRADRFGADALILWEHSRGSRRVGEWVELIDLLEQEGVRIGITTHGRMYDCGNARDRRSLLEDSIDSAFESDKGSVRAKRAAAANAAEGRPHGGPVPWGYTRTYDARTGRLAGQEPDPKTAPHVRELFRRVAAGHSLKSIAADFNDRGVLSPRGKPWRATQLGRLARNPAYVGQRVHKGEVVGEAAWEPLVDRTLWLAVQRVFSDPARRTTRNGRATHLLSGIGRCGHCGGPLAAKVRPERGGTRVYQCNARGCVRVDADTLDQHVTAVMLAYLARPDTYQQLSADDGADDRVDEARRQVAEIRAELDDLYDQVGQGKVSASLAARSEPQITERLRAAEAREAELATPSKLAGLITPGADVADRWDAAPIEARREIARILLSPDVLGELRIVKATTRGVPIEGRIVWKREG